MDQIEIFTGFSELWGGVITRIKYLRVEDATIIEVIRFGEHPVVREVAELVRDESEDFVNFEGLPTLGIV